MLELRFINILHNNHVKYETKVVKARLMGRDEIICQSCQIYVCVRSYFENQQKKLFTSSSIIIFFPKQTEDSKILKSSSHKVGLKIEK